MITNCHWVIERLEGERGVSSGLEELGEATAEDRGWEKGVRGGQWTVLHFEEEGPSHDVGGWRAECV